jgi:RNase P/RNase MRP subunit POP5
MIKMEKKLKPSLRENKRYVLFEGKKEEVEDAILKFIGILGYAKAGVAFVNNDILAVNREELDKVRAALILAGINVRKVSGTIAGLK